MDQKYIVALEHSGTQVKGVLASVAMNNNGTLPIPTIEAIATVDNTDCVQYGRVQNVLNAAESTKIVIDKLAKAAEAKGLNIEGAHVALAGRSLLSESASADTALPPETPVTAEILRKLFVEASNKATPKTQVLKVLPRKYWGNSQLMSNPIGNICNRLRGEFTIVTCNPTNKRNLEMMMEKMNAGFDVRDYRVTPLAQADMLLDEEAKQLGCVLLDIGYQTITISVYKDRALQYLAVLPMGSHNITLDIAIGMNWTVEKAEKFKCEKGDATASESPSGSEDDRANTYVAARAYEMVVNISANLGYAGFKPSDLSMGFVLTGRGARLNNFDNLLSNQTKMKVRYASMPTTINFNADISKINPDDFISIVSIVNQVARKSDFKSCTSPIVVEVPQPEPQPVAEPEIVVETPPQPKPKPQPVVTPPQPVAREKEKPAVQPTTPSRETAPSSKQWDKDDPETESVNEPKPTRGRNILEKLRQKFTTLMSDPDFGDDQLL